MRVLVLGCGLVGKELARQLRAEGHQVVGTTTTPGKVETLKEFCDDVAVLRGSDREKVHAAAQGCDAIVVCAGPAAQQAMTPEQRKATYHEVLVATAESAATAPISGPVIALSSFSVYGDAANGLDVIDEQAPLTTADDASPACFQAAERAYLEHAGSRACILRLADVCGGDDPPIEKKVKMAHQLLGGSVPFEGQALFYRVHVDDVVAAIKHSLDKELRGIFNCTHAEVPPRNDEFFNAVGALYDLPPMTFRDELKAPGKPISSEKLTRTGFEFKHTVAERMPDADARPASDGPAALNFQARDQVTATLQALIKRFGLTERTAGEGAPYMTLTAQGGPLDGKKVGEVRVFSGGPIHKLVYTGMTVEEFGLDTHQILATTAPDSAAPHFNLDMAISPNTDGTFHIGVDLLPRVDLGACLPYIQECFQPLGATFDSALALPGVNPATSVGPFERSVRSPWMIAAFTTTDGLKAMQPSVDAYIEQFAKLADGLSGPTLDAVADQNLAERDRRNRAAIFSPEVNRVWVLLDRMLGAEQGQALRDVLVSQNVG